MKLVNKPAFFMHAIMSDTNDENIANMKKAIISMENELSIASFSGNKERVNTLLEQLKEFRKILHQMGGELK